MPQFYLSFEPLILSISNVCKRQKIYFKKDNFECLLENWDYLWQIDNFMLAEVKKGIFSQ